MGRWGWMGRGWEVGGRYREALGKVGFLLVLGVEWFLLVAVSRKVLCVCAGENWVGKFGEGSRIRALLGWLELLCFFSYFLNGFVRSCFSRCVFDASGRFSDNRLVRVSVRYEEIKNLRAFPSATIDTRNRRQ